ncbi:MAG: TniB family NTP-binding protein [Pseudomonadota bacterium]
MGDSTWDKEVIDRLNSKIVAHRNFKLARARLNAAILVRQLGECIVLTGPSRNGKTTIVKEVEKLHNGTDTDALLTKRPVVRFTARNKSDRGQFTTRTFYLSALKSIRHPFFTLTGTDLVENFAKIKRMNTESNDTLVDVFENALEVLSTRYLIVDETHHLRYLVGGDASACKVLESLKTLAESVGCVIIFVGAYPILDVIKLAPHILGREYPIDLPRYQATARSDMLEFERILSSFSKGIEFEKGVSSLRDWNDVLFDGSLGVPGLLSAWVRNAISEMQARGESRLRLAHVKHSRKPIRDRKELLAEIEAGELYMDQSQDDEELDPKQKASEKASEEDKKPKRKGAFQANPKRRKAGGRS